MNKKKAYNLALCRHHVNDIARVFLLPDDVDVRPMDQMLCDTARAKDQTVTVIAHNVWIKDEDLDEYLRWMGTNRGQLKEITGVVNVHKFGEKNDEPEDEEECLTTKDLLQVAQTGCEAINKLIRDIAEDIGNCPEDDENVMSLLLDVSKVLAVACTQAVCVIAELNSSEDDE